MLKLIVLATLLSLVASEGLANFEGDWTAVKVYPEVPIDEDCHIVTIETTNDHCKCGNNKKTPVIEVKTVAGNARIPVIAVEAQEEVERALRKKCTCKAKSVENFYMVFRFLSDNYFQAYNSQIGSMFTILFAKEVRSEKEIDDFAQTIDTLRNKTGAFVCSIEKNGNKKASTSTTGTTHWMNWRPTNTTFEASTASETNN